MTSPDSQQISREMELTAQDARDDMLAFPCFSISAPIMVIECKFPFGFLGFLATGGGGRNIKDVPPKSAALAFNTKSVQIVSLCEGEIYPVLSATKLIHSPAGGLDEENGPPPVARE